MRVLMVTEYHRYGGCETHVATLRKHLELRGHKTELVAMYETAARDTYKGHTVIRKAVDAFQPDVVHMHNVGAMRGPMAWVMGMGIPNVLSLHDYWAFCPERMAILNGLPCQQPCAENCYGARSQGAAMKELVSAAQVRVTFNENSAQMFREHGIDVEVIPHGMDFEGWAPSPVKKARAMFACSQAGYYAKGERFFDAMIGRDLPMAYKVIGRPQEEVKQGLADSLVFVHAGIFQETFCLAIIEAMASGCAVISFDSAGPRSIITPETGILVPIGDVAGMRMAFGQLVNNPQAAVAMGKAGREMVLEKYQASRMAADYEKLYERILAKPVEGEAKEKVSVG